MYRRYHKMTLTTLTIDCIFFAITTAITTPFKILRLGYRLRPKARLNTIDDMSGLQFEWQVAHMLKRRGYERVRLTERYDFGVDIVAEKDGVRWGIQVKRHSGLVKASAVRQVVTALKIYNCDRSMVVTNSSFSRVAASLARSNDCVLVDRRVLASWL